MSESQLIQALAATTRRVSQPGASLETIDLALAELRLKTGIDCVLTEGRLEVRWPEGVPQEARPAFEETLTGLVSLAREAHIRAAEGVLDADAFGHELQRCASAARWRDRKLAIAVFEVNGMSLRPGVDGSQVVALVGAAARSAVRQGDVVGHLGAGRFALLFPRAGAFEARAAYRRVREAVAAIEGHVVSCTAAGFAELEEGGDANLLGQALARLNDARLRRSYTGPHMPDAPQPLAG